MCTKIFDKIFTAMFVFNFQWDLQFFIRLKYTLILLHIDYSKIIFQNPEISGQICQNNINCCQKEPNWSALISIYHRQGNGLLFIYLCCRFKNEYFWVVKFWTFYDGGGNDVANSNNWLLQIFEGVSSDYTLGTTTETMVIL